MEVKRRFTIDLTEAEHRWLAFQKAETGTPVVQLLRATIDELRECPDVWERIKERARQARLADIEPGVSGSNGTGRERIFPGN